MRYITITISILLLIIPHASAAIVYPYLDCEKVAKDNAKSHAMGLVFIHELYDNGASKKGDYVGHWMNVKEIHGKKYYIDMTYQRIFTSKDEVSMFWGDITSINGHNRKNEVFDLTVESPPFGIIYHYK
jgi:hypothetical protein